MYRLPINYSSRTPQGRKTELIHLLEKHSLLTREEIERELHPHESELSLQSPQEDAAILFPDLTLYPRTLYMVKEEMDTGKSDKTVDTFLFRRYDTAKAFFEKEKLELKKLMDGLSDEWETDDDTETHFIAQDNCYEKYGEITLRKKQVY